MLLEATSVFQHLPTIILPVNLSLHWGYINVKPDLESGGAVIMWGESLDCSPPGLLETFRLYLVLLYRGVRFEISAKNHTLDVMGFARQRDRFSCGFYVLAVMSRFSSGSSNDRPPVRVFEEYDRAVTERYREVWIRAYVLHILYVATNEPRTVRFGLYEVSTSLKDDCRKVVEAANAGVWNMYPDMSQDKLPFLLLENICELVKDVTVIDYEGFREGEEGIISKLLTGEERKSFIRTFMPDYGVFSLSFGDIIDPRTIFNDKRCDKKTHLVSPVQQEATVEMRETCVGSTVGNGTGDTMGQNAKELPGTSALPISALCNEASQKPEEEEVASLISYHMEEVFFTTSLRISNAV